jgi:dihydropteroate synthase
MPPSRRGRLGRYRRSALIDLNKNTRQSLELIRRLGEIATIGLPVLMAVSNNDFSGETLDTHWESGSKGALPPRWRAFFRVRESCMHNVAAAVAAVHLTEAILGFQEPAFMRHNVHRFDARQR